MDPSNTEMKRILGSFHLPNPIFLVLLYIYHHPVGSPCASSNSHGAASCFKMLSSLRIPTFDTLYPDQPLGGSTVVMLSPAELSLLLFGLHSLQHPAVSKYHSQVRSVTQQLQVTTAKTFVSSHPVRPRRRRWQSPGGSCNGSLRRQ